MIEGEMIQRDQNGRIDVDEAGHLEVVRRKTALMFSACCRTPGMLARAPEGIQLGLQRYGLDLGIAYQLVDDLLDFTGDEKTLGKPTLNDLKEGKLTLPLIYLLRKGDPRHAEMIRTVIADHGFDRIPRERILSLLHEHGCLAKGRATAVGYVQRARGHLEGFPEGPYKQALESVLDLVLDRDR
jgi:octaprenyl-diphosphate synthase